MAYVTLRTGGGPPSNDWADRLPLPVMITVSALPGAHPGRLTTSWITDARFGVSWSGPEAPTGCHGGTGQATEAVVRGREEMLNAAARSAPSCPPAPP